MSEPADILFDETDFYHQVCELNCDKVRVCRIAHELKSNKILGKLKISDCTEFVQVE